MYPAFTCIAGRGVHLPWNSRPKLDTDKTCCRWGAEGQKVNPRQGDLELFSERAPSRACGLSTLGSLNKEPSLTIFALPHNLRDIVGRATGLILFYVALGATNPWSPGSISQEEGKCALEIHHSPDSFPASGPNLVQLIVIV